MQTTQLDLFTEPRVVFKPRYYKDLNIHERINVKANSLCFARVYILQLRPGFDKVSIIMRDSYPEGIRWNRLKQHNKLNPKSWDTILWREKRNKEKLELKLK
jgi:hypothetical protein